MVRVHVVARGEDAVLAARAGVLVRYRSRRRTDEKGIRATAAVEAVVAETAGRCGRLPPTRDRVVAATAVDPGDADKAGRREVENVVGIVARDEDADPLVGVDLLDAVGRHSKDAMVRVTSSLVGEDAVAAARAGVP